MGELNVVKEVGTHYSELVCDECELELDSQDCDGCSGVLFEPADFREGDKIIHVETEKCYLHFCSKECAEKYLKQSAVAEAKD